MSDFLIPLVYLIALLLWTLVLRLFPRILTTTIEKKIEGHHATKLASFTGELEAKYSTLRTSVDYLSMQQTALRSHIIAAVEVLWNEILRLEKKFSHLLVLDTLFVATEIEGFYASGAKGDIGRALHEYRNLDDIHSEIRGLNDPDVERARLFSGERLWLLFFTMRGIYGRYMMLTHMSLRDNKYHDWRDDKLVMGHLDNCLPPNVIEKAKSQAMGGVQLALSYVKASFLKEAVRVMSGSQQIAESLADLQSTLLTEKQRLDLARAAKVT